MPLNHLYCVSDNSDIKSSVVDVASFFNCNTLSDDGVFVM